MNNKWKRVLGIILAVNLLLLLLSVWSLFLPHGGYGMMSFGTMFPAWLITMILLVSVLFVFAIVEDD